MRIGELARAARTRVSAVRYYERVGLLRPTSRTHAGYRDYGDDALRRISLIRRAQEIGFTLREVAIIVGSNGSVGEPAKLRDLIDSRLAASRARLASLHEIERTLVALRARLLASDDTQALAFDALSQMLMKEAALMTTGVAGWFLAGSRPEAYQVGLANESYREGAVAFLRSAGDPGEGFGTLMQQIAPDDYRSKRLSFSAFMRADGVHRGGLWMRVDGPGGQQLAFDNMQQNRPITGTKDWQRYEVVLDVDQSAQKIAFGVLLVGLGELRIARCAVESVGTDVLVTAPAAPKLPTRPRSLGFEEGATQVVLPA